jgi:hypothetical protein
MCQGRHFSTGKCDIVIIRQAAVRIKAGATVMVDVGSVKPPSPNASSQACNVLHEAGEVLSYF